MKKIIYGWRKLKVLTSEQKNSEQGTYNVTCFPVGRDNLLNEIKPGEMVLSVQLPKIKDLIRERRHDLIDLDRESTFHSAHDESKVARWVSKHYQAVSARYQADSLEGLTDKLIS